VSVDTFVFLSGRKKGEEGEERTAGAHSSVGSVLFLLSFAHIHILYLYVRMFYALVLVDIIEVTFT